MKREHSTDETATAPPRRSGPRSADLLPALVRLDGEQGLHVLRLREVTIGRGTDVDLRVDSTSISRNHVKVVMAIDGLVNVIDLGAKNGTFINGARVDLAVLRDGDVLQLGPEVRFRFCYHDPRKQVEPPPELTTRQLKVAQLVACGLTNVEVAARLEISQRTVSTHLDHIYERLGLRSRTELTRYLADRGLLECIE